MLQWASVPGRSTRPRARQPRTRALPQAALRRHLRHKPQRHKQHAIVDGPTFHPIVPRTTEPRVVRGGKSVQPTPRPVHLTGQTLLGRALWATRTNAEPPQESGDSGQEATPATPCLSGTAAWQICGGPWLDMTTHFAFTALAPALFVFSPVSRLKSNALLSFLDSHNSQSQP